MSGYARQYEGTELYRAAVKVMDADGQQRRTFFYGPYDTPGKAQARLTSATKHPRYDGLTNVGHVEGCRPAWVPVDQLGDVVQLTRAEYESLREADRLLDRLYAAGVDNWEGYSEAAYKGSPDDDD